MKFNLKQEQNFNNDEAKINELIRDINTLPKNYTLHIHITHYTVHMTHYITLCTLHWYTHHV
jgi:hypothetical protein